MLLYALTTLVSAFLLFQVEPIIAKIILPWFGGSAAVWTVCLLFFQLALLGGYLYAHALIRFVKPGMQVFVHASLLVASLLALPIYPGSSWKPLPGQDPTLGILLLLAAKVGAPYFLLSTTGPLLQAWYARTHDGAMPYRLYALSNAGSMAALLSYPFLFEPVFTTHEQAGMWTIGYCAFIAICAATAFFAAKAKDVEAKLPTPLAAEESPSQTAGAGRYWMWVALPACASVLLLGITNHLSQNVAAIPFLWVLPLSIYLLTFILCFEGSGWYFRMPYIPVYIVAAGSMVYAIGKDLTGNLAIYVLIPLFCIGLFIGCMVCHGELVRVKPHPSQLTMFYLMISAGGALGGLLVGLAAPKLLNGFYELPLGLVVTSVILILVLKQDKELEGFQNWFSVLPIGAIVLTIGLTVYVGLQIHEFVSGARVTVRNFYGGLRVRDTGTAASLDGTRSLTHGTINHGEQFLYPSKRDLPTTYYGPNTGVGVAIREKQKIGAVRIGVVGLGTGTVAAYGRWGDYVRYYEINPLVRWIATTQFTFVPDCRAKLDIAMGDARLSLEREQPENFDVLAVDAFSSDSIPVHLLTKEAMQLYFHHLKPDGILAVHISNRYLDLAPPLEGEARALGKTARVVDTEDDDTQDVFGATWVLLISPPYPFSDLEMSSSTALESKKKVRLWTDDYSNLFQILK